MEKYKCKICDQQHDYYGSFPLVSLPEIIEKMSDGEKAKLVKMHEHLYHLEDSFFLCKGDFYIKVISQDWFVHWEIWAKIKEAEFYSMVEDLKPNSNFRIKAKLASPIIHYNTELDSPINLVFNFEDENSYPEMEPVDRFSELGQDFQNGISLTKLKKWIEKIHHP